MLFRKKEEKTLPDLPPSPFDARPGAIPSLEADTEEKALPSFPASETYDRFSEAAIKGAVGEAEEELPEFPEMNTAAVRSNTMEMEEWTPSNMPVQSPTAISPLEEEENLQPEIPSRARRAMPRIVRSAVEQTSSSQLSDVFVKLDKFHLARRTLHDVSSKLEEMDELIKKIRETKLREERELSAWEKDIVHIKSRVKDVNENIFEKVE